MDPILEIAKHNGLYVVEDCAEALGAKYKGQQVGGIGDVGCFSFFANKTITTGEGGMVVTNNPALQEKMKILRDHGMSKERRYWHLYAGFNYRMTNLQAAIGLAQMERIDSFLAHRQRVAQHYSQQLCGVNGIILPPKTDWAENIYWLYSVVIDEQRVGMGREDLVVKLTDCGIETRPFFYPLHVQPPYFSESNYDCPVSCWLAERGLSLPTSNSIDLNDIDRVCDSVERIINDNKLIRSHVNGSLVMEFVCDDRTMFQPIQERVGANSKERPSAFGG
jgi:perosamine synthetase